MPRGPTRPDPARQAQLAEDLRRDQETRLRGYREQALKLFPHVCGRCAREFSGKKLRELTVHHKDGDHNNNPSDGSNWEMLCLYCHDEEHERSEAAGHGGGADRPGTSLPSPLHRPLGGLADLLRRKRDEPGEEP